MYDSVTYTDIPQGVDMVAGYIDGLYAWEEGAWTYHSRSRQVRITVLGQDLSAHVADIENGDLTVQQGVDWARRKILIGQVATLYFSLGLFGAVQAEIDRVGITPPEWGVWIADWTGSPHLLAGTFATQYDHPPTSGGHYDLSLVGDYWPTVDPPPPPSGGPGATGTAEISVTVGGNGYVTVDGVLAPAVFSAPLGSVHTFQAVPGNDSRFLRWEGTGGESLANPLTVTLSALSGSLNALFGLLSTTQPPGGGGGAQPPPPSGGAPVDDARLAWGDLGSALTVTLPGTVAALAVARGKLQGQI